MSPRVEGPEVKWFVTAHVEVPERVETTVAFTGSSEFDVYRKIQSWTTDTWRPHFPEAVREKIIAETQITLTLVVTEEESAAYRKREQDRAVAEAATKTAGLAAKVLAKAKGKTK